MRNLEGDKKGQYPLMSLSPLGGQKGTDGDKIKRVLVPVRGDKRGHIYTPLGVYVPCPPPGDNRKFFRGIGV